MGGSHYEIAQKFGIGEGTVRSYCLRCMEAVLSLEKEFCSWPPASQRGLVRSQIETISGFPNCIGMIDGSHFTLLNKPQIDPECYFTRKSRYALNCLLVCDHRRIFTFYSVGHVGSVHDNRVLRCSKLASETENYFVDKQYILGDSAYGTNFSFIVSPYKRPLADVGFNRTFNYLLSKSRITIEHAIGILKSRFPRLRDGFTEVIRDEKDNEFVCKAIVSAIILHNVCRVVNDIGFQDIEEEQEDIIEDDGNNLINGSAHLRESVKSIVLS